MCHVVNFISKIKIYYMTDVSQNDLQFVKRLLSKVFSLMFLTRWPCKLTIFNAIKDLEENNLETLI